MDDSGLFEFDLLLERTIKTAKVNRIKKSLFESGGPQPLRRSLSTSDLNRSNNKCTDSFQVRKLKDDSSSLVSDKFKKPDVDILLNTREKVNQFMELLSNCELKENEDPSLKSFYVTNYLKNRKSLAELLFYLFNRHVFDSKLPADIQIEWSGRLTSAAGMWYSKRAGIEIGKIILAPKLLDSADKLRDTLVHEMCHAATTIISKERDRHGRFWRYWTVKANLEFSKLPIITRCHQYKSNQFEDDSSSLVSDAFKKPDVDTLLNTREKVNQFMELLSNCELKENEDPSLKGFYVTHYLKNRKSLAELLFSLFNRHVFDNKLPTDIQIEWSGKLTSTAGLWYSKRAGIEIGKIILAPKLLDSADKLRDTLVHEMCHAATTIISKERDRHGRFWRYWTVKANLEFSKLPIITRCHQYKSNTLKNEHQNFIF